MIREWIYRGAAAAVTLLFIAAVRPDPEPSRIEAAFISVLMYEAIRWCLDYCANIRQHEYVTLDLSKRKEISK